MDFRWQVPVLQSRLKQRYLVKISLTHFIDISFGSLLKSKNMIQDRHVLMSFSLTWVSFSAIENEFHCHSIVGWWNWETEIVEKEEGHSQIEEWLVQVCINIDKVTRYDCLVNSSNVEAESKKKENTRKRRQQSIQRKMYRRSKGYLMFDVGWHAFSAQTMSRWAGSTRWINQGSGETEENHVNEQTPWKCPIESFLAKRNGKTRVVRLQQKYCTSDDRSVETPGRRCRCFGAYHWQS